MIIIVKTPNGNKIRTIDTAVEPAIILFNQDEISTVVDMQARGDDILTSGPVEEMESANKNTPFHKWIEEARKILSGMVRLATPAKREAPQSPAQQINARRAPIPMRMPAPTLVASKASVEIQVVPEKPAAEMETKGGSNGSMGASRQVSDAEIISIVDERVTPNGQG